MVKFYSQSFGNMLAIGIGGQTRQEVEEWYNSLYNREATSGELHWTRELEGDFFGFIWTNEKKFKKWLLSSSLAIILNAGGGKKGKKGGGMDAARQLAEKRLKEIEEKEFVYFKKNLTDFYELGDIDLDKRKPEYDGQRYAKQNA